MFKGRGSMGTPLDPRPSLHSPLSLAPKHMHLIRIDHLSHRDLERLTFPFLHAQDARPALFPKFPTIKGLAGRARFLKDLNLPAFLEVPATSVVFAIFRAILVILD